MSTVPKSITPALLAFCGTIATGRPVFIRSKPSADARPSACFDNVARKIERAGGTIAYGWAIWHVPRLYFEAEHHGVWRNRQNVLVDVSPQIANARLILFLPDETATYNPTNHRSNVIAPAAQTTISQEIASLANERSRLIDSYRTNEHMAVTLSRQDQMKVDSITRRIAALLAQAGVIL
ncbi:MAG TPA: hypothetical protein VMG08_08820 [Allosphingosinicella sp.]|nr:hypothetical protein [Allosphingosinicella sp.]